MFAIAAFGYLFGSIGLLIAVPLAAAIGVVVRFATRQYLVSLAHTTVEPASLLSPRDEAPSRSKRWLKKVFGK